MTDPPILPLAPGIHGDLGFPAFRAGEDWKRAIVGMLICNDRRWPEAWRVLGLQGVELVCLAGFMRLLTGEFCRAFPLRALNIHPSLLPAFPGLDAQQQAIEHGAKISGCTVHFVDQQLDGGPIILQAAVPVLDGDTEHTLAARILVEEHRIYSQAIGMVLSGRWRIEGRRVMAE